MIQYRRMEKKDTDAVTILFEDCFSHPWKKEAIGEMVLTDGYLSLVAESEHGIVGYIGFRQALDEADITNVAVSPEQRRKGIGRQLLARLLQLAADREITSIYLEVRISNHAAIALYEQAGFHVLGQRKNYYSQPEEDALLMLYKL